MVSRRVYTRDDLRNLKRIYHPGGNFHSEFSGRYFDLIFEEFLKDPSLPNELIPDLNTCVDLTDSAFLYRNKRERSYGLFGTFDLSLNQMEDDRTIMREKTSYSGLKDSRWSVKLLFFRKDAKPST